MTNNKATIARPKNAPLSKLPQTSVKSTTKASKSSGQHPPKQYARQKKNSQQQQQQQPNKAHVTKATPAPTTTTASPSPRSNKKSKQEWDALKNQRLPSKHQQQQQRKPNVMSSKARRVERKRDIVSMTDAIQSLDLSSSPPCSSSDSDNSDAIQVSKKKVNKQRSTTMTKPGPAAFPPLKRNQQRRSHNNNAATTSSAAKVYCGPCFSNAPAPSALPIPAFNPSSPTISYQQQPTYDHDGVFAIEDYSLQQQSQQLMSLLAPRHPQQQPHPSMMPTPMVTGHPPHDTTEQTLSEIQRGLRSMLKIST